MSNLITKWNYPTTIYHGQNSIDLVPEILNNNNIKNPLVITDNYLAQSNNLDEFKKLLTKNNVYFSIFSELSSDPDREIVYQALDVLKTNNHDSVIIIGGGSALDLGKTVALMANHNHDLWNFEDGHTHYKDISPDLILPSIAIPTTAGTGSEVGRVAVIIDNEADSKNYHNKSSQKIKRKKFIFHKNLIPNWVILDPMLTQSMPAHLTAATAMDALTHAIEAYCVDSYHPMADGIAIEAIKLVKNNILEVYTKPDNLIARGNMLSAATMGATAFQKGLGLVHSLSHPIGAVYKIHHGLLNAVLLPYVLLFNQNKIEKKMAILVSALGLDLHQSKSASPKNNTEVIINWILDIRKKLNLPHSLADIKNNKISINNPMEIDLIITEALADPSTPTNPVTPNYENLTKLFNNCYYGNLSGVSSD